MASIKDRAAREKIIRARTNLLVTNGFFGFLAMQLRLVEDYDIPTAAVDGISMFYNPNFVHQLDERECEFLVAHEVMHCCFKHFTRRGSRDPRAWNIAGDFVINLDLQTAGFKLIHNRLINGKNFKCCIDPQFKGMSTEQVYDTFPKIDVYMQMAKGDGSGGDDSDPGGCGGVRDAPGEQGGKDHVERTWETAVRTAVAVAQQNNAGQIPGSLQSLIKELNKPKVSWRELTRRWVDQSMSKVFSWSRPSRRGASTGLLLPGLVSDSLNKLVCFVDISGSIQIELARQMVSECAGALDQGTADTVVIAYADTEVQHVDEYQQGDLVTCGHYHGGGTDFRDSFEWLRRNHPDASCVIYLTDLQVNEYGEDPGIPVLWATYAPDAYYDELAGRVPFGEPIHISNYS